MNKKLVLIKSAKLLQV